ncbi:MAG: HPr family phosphocarrier protein [Pontiellaceae bacterium]|nr:HPr family phosphocarrier protein [Pontiellaceae bacterium]MBN2785095.1 HPr family phosphocarrier protein [Pontiellaceae bacterium]
MRKTQVTVQWDQGLHARPATRLVQLARNYHSTILIHTKGKVADAKSIMSVMLLCATVGTLLEIEAVGDDEHMATAAIEQLFEQEISDGPDREQAKQDLIERGWYFGGD